MIYTTEQSAKAAAAMLNTRKGYAPAKAVLTANGWTVIASWK